MTTCVNPTANESLEKAGFTIHWFTEYHGRIKEGIDIYCSSKRQSVGFIDRENKHKNGVLDPALLGDAIGDYIWNKRKEDGKTFTKPYF